MVTSSLATRHMMHHRHLLPPLFSSSFRFLSSSQLLSPPTTALTRTCPSTSFAANSNYHYADPQTVTSTTMMTNFFLSAVLCQLMAALVFAAPVAEDAVK